MIKSIGLGILFFLLFELVTTAEWVFISRLYPTINELSKASPTIFGVDLYYVLKILTVIVFTVVISVFTNDRKIVFISFIGIIVSYEIISNMYQFGQLTAFNFLFMREGFTILISGITFILANRFMRK